MSDDPQPMRGWTHGVRMPVEATVARDDAMPADGVDDAVQRVTSALQLGATWVFIDGPGASARRLLRAVRAVVATRGARGHDHVRVLVRSRVDVALAGGADGVVLDGHDLPVSAVRRLAPPPFLIVTTARQPGDLADARDADAVRLILPPARNADDFAAFAAASPVAAIAVDLAVPVALPAGLAGRETDITVWPDA